jgi:hypothetical protein
MESVRDFVRGVVEPEEAELHALLPGELAAALGLAEEVRLATAGSPLEGAAGAGVDARLGSPLLERLLEARRSSRPVATVALPGQLPRPLPDETPALLNAVRAGPTGARVRAPARYVVLNMRLTIAGDEVRSSFGEVTVRLEDGARVSSLNLGGAYPTAPAPLTPAEVVATKAALRAWIPEAAPRLLAGALDAIGRRGRRDLGRVADYYASLDADMARAVDRARTDDERGRRLAKRAMLPQELAARRAQVRERLAARIAAEMVAAVVVETETDRFEVPARRRSQAGVLFVQRRAADGALEGPRCAACALSALRLYLCDDRLHALCDGCGRAGRLDATRCPACRPRAAPPLAVTVEDATALVRVAQGRASP